MAGMLTVVNPRRRRRVKRHKATAKKTSRRRRRRAIAVARNPHRRRVHSRRRRVHRNPLRMGGIVGTLTKGVAVGAGAIVTNLATNQVNKMLGANALAGPGKIALKIGVGLVALPMILKFVPGGRKFAASAAIGAGVAVALDIYDQFIKHMLPASLQDYSYGSLNDYQAGSLNDWAPQAEMSGGGVYDDGVYS